MHWIYHLGIVVLSAPRQCVRCLITGDCWMRRYGVFTFLVLLQKEYFPFFYSFILQHYTFFRLVNNCIEKLAIKKKKKSNNNCFEKCKKRVQLQDAFLIPLFCIIIHISIRRNQFGFRIKHGYLESHYPSLQLQWSEV